MAELIWLFFQKAHRFEFEIDQTCQTLLVKYYLCVRWPRRHSGFGSSHVRRSRHGKLDIEGIVGLVTWGLLGPESIAIERRTRTLNLGACVRTFNDLAVPGLGGVWFGKQLF